MSPSAGGVVCVAVMLPIVDTVAVASRFWVRRMKKAQLKSDDWTILVALVCNAKTTMACTFSD